MDFCSLYPSVQYFKEYPIGHPDIIIAPEKYNKDWFGFIKCKILSPHGLYHPVLPLKVKCNNAEKLLFPLCKQCAIDKQDKCDHSDKQRAFIGTWTTCEVQKALEKGYTIQRIYDVWNFKEKTDNLFKNYVRRFLKIKMESSKLEVGPDSTYKTVDKFKEVVKQKLEIDLGEVAFNSGMRAIAKLYLNSLWSKFGQRNNMKQILSVTDVSEFYENLLDDTNDNMYVQFIFEDMVQMTFDKKNQFIDNSNDTNIYIAFFTTSHAILMLYDVLDQLKERVLGFDTDSDWYIEKPSDKKNTNWRQLRRINRRTTR